MATLHFKIFLSHLLLAAITVDHAKASEIDCSSPNKISVNDILSSADTTQGRTFKDFQTPAVDYSKVDNQWRSKVQLLTEEIPLRNLEVLAPDYQEAIVRLKQNMVDGWNLYYTELDKIRNQTVQTLSPLFSKLQALEDASKQDNTGVILDGLHREQKLVLKTIEKLQQENQIRYSAALETLTQSTSIESIEDLDKEMNREIETETKRIEQETYNWDYNDVLDTLYRISIYQTKLQIEYSDRKTFTKRSTFCINLKDLTADWDSYTKTCSVAPNLVSDLLSTMKPIKVNNRHDIRASFLASLEQRKVEYIETRKNEIKARYLKLKETDNNPLLKCRSYICAKLLKTDIMAYRRALDKSLVDLNFSNILKKANRQLGRQILDYGFSEKLNLKNTAILSSDWFRSPLWSIERISNNYAETLPTAILKQKLMDNGNLAEHTPCPQVNTGQSKKIDQNLNVTTQGSDFADLAN